MLGSRIVGPLNALTSRSGTTEPRTKDPKGKGKGKEKTTSVGTEWINALLEESGDPYVTTSSESITPSPN